MKVWHLGEDTPRRPFRAKLGEPIELVVGTWPIEPGQSVWVDYQVDGDPARRVTGSWRHNAGPNSYWTIVLGPFPTEARVTYTVFARGPGGEVAGPSAAFRAGAKLALALLWHQHQPWYVDPRRGERLRQPWVRLHALRDYVGMAALLRDHPGVHATINLTPVLVEQIDRYVRGRVVDRALELTTVRAAALSRADRDELLASFFDADWHHQIFVHDRYCELFEQRRRGDRFSDQDVTDLQMWFNLAWFAHELRTGEVVLPGGEIASVRRFVERGRGFSRGDLDDMLAVQHALLAAVVPLHRELAARGQIELSTTPFYHPILPLLIDSDGARLDRPGTGLPRRFAHPEDADAQVRLAIEHHAAHFGAPPRGMWPAEGAVSPAAMELLARHGIAWAATDAGVLAQSGRWGYRVDDPDVLCRPYRTGEPGLALLFRDPDLSNEIGFRLQAAASGQAAADTLVAAIEDRFVGRLSGADDRVVTVALDGENAWGAYPDDGRPFLRALYARLADHPAIETVTPSQVLDRTPAASLPRVHELATSSWADEPGSAPGVDLGTWIGEREENAAWELLGDARDALAAAGASPASAPAAFAALYAAEGSDWFWWFGDDQESGSDEDFDDLFRANIEHAYRAAGLDVPARASVHLVSHKVVWTFTRPVDWIDPGDRLVVRTGCFGELAWCVDDGAWVVADLAPAGGVMVGPTFHAIAIGPFLETAHRVRFRFRCKHLGCAGTGPCCHAGEQQVGIGHRVRSVAANGV